MMLTRTQKTISIAMVLGSAALAAAQTAPAPPPYALPWQLRPAAVGNLVRVDTTVARYQDAGGPTTDVVTLLTGAYRLGPRFAPSVRVGVASHAPDDGDGGAALTNVALGATYLVVPKGPYRVAAFLGVTLPIGMGGGNAPAPDTATAVRSGVLARSALDNAMFAVNDLALFPGIDVAWITPRLTVQAEATLFQLFRVRGADAQPDQTKTNLTTGLSVGSWLVPRLSVVGELRYQRWLSTPAAVEANDVLRDNLSVTAGLRGLIKLGGKRMMRPGIALGFGLDDPMGDREYKFIQVDVPVVF